MIWWYPREASMWANPSTSGVKKLHLAAGHVAACKIQVVLCLDLGECDPPILRRCRRCQKKLIADAEKAREGKTEKHVSATHDFRCPQCGHMGDFSCGVENGRVVYFCHGRGCGWRGPAEECFTVLREGKSKD